MVSTGETGTPVSSEQKAHAESTPVEAPKPVPVRGAPRDAQEVFSDNYLALADTASLSAQHKSKQPVFHTVLPDFLKEDFLGELRESLNHEDWFQQKSDICTFEQTADLKQSTQVMQKEIGLTSRWLSKILSTPFQELSSDNSCQALQVLTLLLLRTFLGISTKKVLFSIMFLDTI